MACIAQPPFLLADHIRAFSVLDQQLLPIDQNNLPVFLKVLTESTALPLSISLKDFNGRLLFRQHWIFLNYHIVNQPPLEAFASRSVRLHQVL